MTPESVVFIEGAVTGEVRTARTTADMVRETQYRWEASEPLPEGWRSGAQWLREDGDMDVLYTSAPEDRRPYDYEHKFVRVRRITQERYVTPWSDVS